MKGIVMDDVWSLDEDAEQDRFYQEEIARCRADWDKTQLGTPEFEEKQAALERLEDEYVVWRADSEECRQRAMADREVAAEPELVEAEGLAPELVEVEGLAPERRPSVPNLGRQVRTQSQLVYKGVLSGREQVAEDAKRRLFDLLPPDAARAAYDKAADDAREKLASNPPFRFQEETKIVIGTRILELATQPELFDNAKDRGVVLAVFSIAYRRGMISKLPISYDQIASTSTVPLTRDEVRRAIDRVAAKRLWFTITPPRQQKPNGRRGFRKANIFRLRQDLIEKDPRLMSEAEVKGSGLIEEVERFLRSDRSS